MPKRKNLSILDVTIRDGSYAINYQYLPEQIGKIAEALDVAGIAYMEVGHGCGLGAGKKLGLPAATGDPEQIHAARNATKRIKIGVIAGPPTITTKEDIDSIINDVDFIRFAANCNKPKTVESNIAYAKKKRSDLAVFLQLMRSTRISKADIVRAGRQAEAMGVTTVYVVDTAGHFIPAEVSDIISTLAAKLKIGVGFHGHNNLGLAVANTIAAVEAGATSVDASLKGMGRAGGNAQLDALVSLLKRMGYAKDVNLDILLPAGEALVSPIAPASAGISMTDLITADANIDLYPTELYEKIADAAGIEFETFARALGKDKHIIEPDVDGVKRALKKLGADADNVMKKFRPPSAGSASGAKHGLPKQTVVIAAQISNSPTLNFPHGLLANLEQRFPSVKFHSVPYHPVQIEHADDANILFTHAIDKKALANFSKLKWLHSTFVGMDTEIVKELERRETIVTVPKGAYSTPMAETVIAFMASFARKVEKTIRFQSLKKWAALDIINSVPPPSELSGSTVAIFGLGSVGLALAAKCKALGMAVAGIVPSSRPVPPFVDELVLFEDREDAISTANFIVLACPLTPKTNGMFGAEEFGAMKNSAFLINIARGALVVEDALLHALKSGKIGGAACDAFATEPLPDNHPLFDAPNMIVMPHISAISTEFWPRAVRYFMNNLESYLTGLQMAGRIDFEKGY